VDSVRKLLEDGLKEGIFPGVVLLVAKHGQVEFFQEAGYRSIIPEKLPMKKDTVFDLASLTKPLATTLAMMKLMEGGVIDLDQPLSELIPSGLLSDKAELTPRLVLCHCAGLVDWRPYYLKLVEHPLEQRKSILREWVAQEPFAYRPGEGSLYSDLGFMILEWVIEEMAGMSLPQFLDRNFFSPLVLKQTFFRGTSEEGNPPWSPFAKGGREGAPRREGRFTAGPAKKEFAATEQCPWRKRIIQGEVHDENAWALGGYSGHAGLFGAAEEVYNIVNLLREHYLGLRGDYLKPETVVTFFAPQKIVKHGTWTLGWDTPSPENSSSGKYFSRNSVGHLGFTGTSIWMDLEKDVVVILLTNRVHPTRNNDKIKAFRPKIHDAMMKELGLGH
jgi:CubicO group peptidase (beta-lactamase class C family)